MVTAFTAVWTEVMTFFVTIFQKISGIFWTPGVGEEPGKLTFVGIMAIIMAGVALILLVFNLIRSFFPMRG